MKILSVVSATLIILSQCAAAEDFEPGLYIAGGPAAVSQSAACAFLTTNCNTPSVGPTSGAPYRLLAGYDIERAFGIEAGVASLGTFSVRSPNRTMVGNLKANAAMLGFKIGRIHPHGISLFGEFGLAHVTTEYTAAPAWVLNGTPRQTSTGFYGGLGVQLDINKTLGFRTSVDFIRFSDAEFDMTTSNISVMAVIKF